MAKFGSGTHFCPLSLIIWLRRDFKYPSYLFEMNQGGSKIQEAYLIFQDFSEKYPMTCLVLNGKAVCCMHMGNFDEAETLLLEALNKVCCYCL